MVIDKDIQVSKVFSEDEYEKKNNVIYILHPQNKENQRVGVLIHSLINHHKTATLTTT